MTDLECKIEVIIDSFGEGNYAFLAVPRHFASHGIKNIDVYKDGNEYTIDYSLLDKQLPIRKHNYIVLKDGTISFLPSDYSIINLIRKNRLLKYFNNELYVEALAYNCEKLKSENFRLKMSLNK